MEVGQVARTERAPRVAGTTPGHPGSTVADNPGLDVVRGVAAVLVLLAHDRSFPLLVAGRPVTGTGVVQEALLLPARSRPDVRDAPTDRAVATYAAAGTGGGAGT